MSEVAKILLIDDDVDFVKATVRILESRPDYKVIVAYNGESGLQMAREEKPDLILLDIIMPLGDGFSVCEELREDPEFENTPILMLTSFSERYGETSLAVSQGYALEADDYIGKPVRPAELFARIDKQLAKRRRGSRLEAPK